MQVRYLLSSFNSAVDRQAITALSYALLLSQILSYDDHPPGKLMMVFSKLSRGCDVYLGYDKYMDRRLRMNIPEGQKVLILVDQIAGEFPGNDPAENTFIRHVPTPSIRLQRLMTSAPAPDNLLGPG
jgi:hypothetical protein